MISCFGSLSLALIDDTISENAVLGFGRNVWIDVPLFCIFVTGSESDRNVVLFHDMVYLGCSSVAFLFLFFKPPSMWMPCL